MTKVIFNLGWGDFTRGGFPNEGIQGATVAKASPVEFQNRGFADGLLGVSGHVDEQTIGIFPVAVGFKGKQHFQVAAPKGNHGGKKVSLLVAIAQFIHIATVVTVFI